LHIRNIKKIFLMLIMTFSLFSLLTFTSAEGSNDISDNVELIDGVTNIKEKYPIVNVMVSGEDLILDVPGILYTIDGKTRTLLPIRVVTDALGYDIKWVQETKEVVINSEDKEIILKIDSSIAYVNGEKITLPDNVPAKVMVYNGIARTLVPARFVAEQLGKEVGWINETRTVEINEPKQYVKDIIYDDEKRFKEIRIKTTGKVRTNSYYIDASGLNKKSKFIVELYNTEFSIDESKFDENKNYNLPIMLYGIDKVRAYEVENKKNIRLEIDLDIRKGFDVYFDNKTNEVVIQFINSVEDIRHEKIYNSGAIVIDTNQNPPDINVKYLTSYVVVDVVNSKLKFNGGTFKSIKVDDDGIDTVSFSQFDPSNEYEKDDMISRVVVSLKDGRTTDDVYIETIDNKVYIYVSGAPLNGFNYAKNSLDSGSLNINFDSSADYFSSYNKENREIVFIVPKSKIKLDDMDVDIDDSIVDNISIISEDDAYRISLILSEGTTYSNKSNDNMGISLSFFNEKLSNSKYRNMLVVVDPGHGGSDVGAVGLRSYEKDLALKLSKKVKKELEGLGFKVYITRENDKKVTLQERVDVANTLNADLFISLHMNSYTSSKPYGLEVLYNPDEKLKNRKLALYVKNNLVKDLNAFDRGIVARPRLYVLRNTKMPSILTELGFISNEQEEIRLMDENYQNKAAKSIVKGIVEFLDN